MVRNQTLRLGWNTLIITVQLLDILIAYPDLSRAARGIRIGSAALSGSELVIKDEANKLIEHARIQQRLHQMQKSSRIDTFEFWVRSRRCTHLHIKIQQLQLDVKDLDPLLQNAKEPVQLSQQISRLIELFLQRLLLLNKAFFNSDGAHQILKANKALVKLLDQEAIVHFDLALIADLRTDQIRRDLKV